MNGKAPVTGFPAVLKSLNCDRAYGIALLCACALLTLLELGGDTVRSALNFDRPAMAAGQWWRPLTANFVHFDATHTMLNAFGVVLMWALFARDFSAGRWVAIYLLAGLSVGAGLWFFNPEYDYYVGASGALHGVMAAGTVAHLRRRDLDGWILAAFIIGKLAYEQVAGQLPFAGSNDTAVDAHLYGAIGGCGVALALKSRGASF